MSIGTGKQVGDKKSRESYGECLWEIGETGVSEFIYVEPRRRDRAFVTPKAPVWGNQIEIRIEIADNNAAGLLIEKGGSQCGWIHEDDKFFLPLMKALEKNSGRVVLRGLIQSIGSPMEWKFWGKQDYKWKNKKRHYVRGTVAWELWINNE